MLNLFYVNVYSYLLINFWICRLHRDTEQCNVKCYIFQRTQPLYPFRVYFARHNFATIVQFYNLIECFLYVHISIFVECTLYI